MSYVAKLVTKTKYEYGRYDYIRKAMGNWFKSNGTNHML